MTKLFCDKCGAEISKEKENGAADIHHAKMGFRAGDHMFRIERTGAPGFSRNVGDICRECVVSYIIEGSGRPDFWIDSVPKD